MEPPEGTIPADTRSPALEISSWTHTLYNCKECPGGFEPQSHNSHKALGTLAMALETVGKMDATGVSAGVEGATARSQGMVMEGPGGSSRHEGVAGLERNYTGGIPRPWLRWER